MSLEEMVALFSTSGLQKKAAIFDPKKLEWMNGQHLSRTPASELEPIIAPELVRDGLTSAEELERRRDWFLELLDLLKVRARTTSDIIKQAVPYFADEIAYEGDAASKTWKNPAESAEILRSVGEKLRLAEPWTQENLELLLRSLADARGIAAGKIFQPLRLALTGTTVSPGIFDVLVAMGRDLSVKRVRAAIIHLESAMGA
jgi:glutamyl-tRNA synthetase